MMRTGTKLELSSSGLCVKYLMFALNFIYFAAGCAVLGVSLWVILERNFMADILGTELTTVGGIMLIVAGSLIILVSFFGCCGALMQSKCMVLTYFIFLLIIFISMLVGGILCLVFRSEIGEEVRGVMRSTLQNDYGINDGEAKHRAITRAWDKTQEFLHCCSVEDQSWNTYRSSEWYKIQPGVQDVSKPFVPMSCCLRDQYDEYYNLDKCQTWMLGPPGRQSGENNNALHYRGCYYAGKDFMYEVSAYLIGIGIGIGLSTVAGIVLSLILYIHLSRL